MKDNDDSRARLAKEIQDVENILSACVSDTMNEQPALPQSEGLRAEIDTFTKYESPFLAVW